MKNDFKVLQMFVDDMRSTSSSNQKKEILEEYKDEEFVMKCLLYVLDPYRKFGVTSKSFKKYVPQKSVFSHLLYDNLFTLLDDFVSRKLTGHTALNALDAFMLLHKEHKELILQVVDKNLKTRANAALVNDVFPKMIPGFSVALAHTYKEKLVKYTDEWFASRKLDGLRCVIKIDKEGDSTFWTKSGIEILTLDVLRKTIKKSVVRDVVFDGEICIMKGDLEDFKSISSEWNMKNHIISNPRYFIFDCLTHAEFNSEVSTRKLYDRLLLVNHPDENFEVLLQTRIESHKDVEKALDYAVSKGQEGLILRKNVGYKGKRSNDILKVKDWIEDEYVVENVVLGSMRFLENGEDIERVTLASVIIKHKGQVVNVGSGFSKEERALYFEHPEQIIGKTITVKYKQESFDADGKVSLNFGTLKAIHGAERVA